MEDYEALSDFEINKLVAEKCIRNSFDSPIKSIEFDSSQGVLWVEVVGFSSFCIGDYCNSWADMGPIMSANEICTRYGSETRSAATVQSGRIIQVTNNNELRAAAIVYLMMGDGQ